MVKLSVIVPVYNVEKYLKRCLNSLINQDLKDIEIIIVNDGSKDNSEKIIEEYVEKYKNIKSFKKTNGGLSDARNYGLKYAKGKYIAFIDSDDYVEHNMFSKMLDKAEENNYDVVVCDLFYEYENQKKVKAYSNIKKDLHSKKEIKENMLNIYPAAWNKIYKRELLNDIKFKKNVWFEDVEFIYRLLPFIKNIGTVKEAFVHYIQREGTITKTFDERLYHQIDNWNGIIDFYKKNKLYENYKKELEYCYVRYLYASFIKQALNYSSYEKYKIAYKTAIKNVKKNFPHYKNNKYFYINGIKGYYLLLFNKSLAKIMYKIKKR